MKTHRTKFLSAAVIAAGLIATVAMPARSIRTRPAARHPQFSHSSAARGRDVAGPAQRGHRLRHGERADCEKIGPLLPM